MNRLFACAIAVAAFVYSASPARAADQPYTFDSTLGRLPKTVVPIDYDIALTPNVAARTTAGTESVRVRVRTATAKVVVNTLEMTVQTARLANGPAATISNDPKLQQTALTFAKPIAPGTYTLQLAFAGKIGAAAQGLFLQEYQTASGGHEAMLATQLESTDARRVFPCWDEPAFRATYRLSVTVPHKFTAVSNMPVATTVPKGSLKTVTFERTPKMSTYLVVFCAGKFTSISDSVDGVKVSVYAPSDRIQNGRYALAAATELLAYYDQYYDYKFPLPKLDLIDVPAGFPGAMENWGGIVFTESLLLFDPKTEPEANKQQIFQTVAHEMSHQWTGDLVTMDWWSRIWLNESFAHWMQIKATDHFNPSWHLYDSEGDNVALAMTTDQRTTAHPTVVPVEDETQAANAFDDVTYERGGSVIRMFEHYLGPDTFRDGVRAYIKAHAYSNATAADLFAGLSSAAHKDVGALVYPWIEGAGVPLVSADATCANGKRTLALSQQRFLVEPGQSSDRLWPIPVGVEVAGTVQYVLLNGKTATVDGGTCDQPFNVNSDALGYYRVKLDDASEDAQLGRFSQLKVAERARFVDDTYALLLAGEASPARLVATLGKVSPGDPLAVWSAVTRATTDLSNLEVGRPGQPAFEAYIVRLLDPVLAHVGWDAQPTDDPQTPVLRGTLVQRLGSAGDKPVIAEAQRRFALFRTNPASLSTELQGPVCTVAGTYADDATWTALHGLFTGTKDRGVALQYGMALWGARDPALAQKNLAMTTNGDITAEDGVVAPYYDVLTVALGGRHPDVAWQFFKGNQDKLATYLTAFEKPVIISIVAPLFWNAAPTSELDAMIDGSDAPPDAKARAKHVIDLKVAQRDRLLPGVDAAVSSGP
jgi:aminopeptidase N